MNRFLSIPSISLFILSFLLYFPGGIWLEAQAEPATHKERADETMPVDPQVCAQVITYGENPLTGEWVEFPTPCDVPEGWQSSPTKPDMGTSSTSFGDMMPSDKTDNSSEVLGPSSSTEKKCIPLGPGEEAVPNEFIVKFRNNARSHRRMAYLRNKVGANEKEIPFIDAKLWQIPIGSASDLCKEPEIEYLYPNYLLKSDGLPNDPDFPKLWGLKKIGLEITWDRITGSEIVIAVIDSGIDYTHPDLVANMWKNTGNGNEVYGFDFANGDGDPFDDYYHGTHCAGIVGAVGNNNIGVVGVNWSIKLMAIKFSSSYGIGNEASAISAIGYATEKGAKIINASWGGTSGPGLKEAIQRAGESGILFVAAAGNGIKNTDTYPYYPASYDLDNIISVAATDQNDNLGMFSNYGAISVDLAAPGVDIYSTLPGNAYGSKEGTSMAAPYVTGVAALVWAANPTFTYQQVKDQILASVDPIPALAGKTVTGGRLNAYQALTKPSTGFPVASCTTSGSGMKVIFDGTASHDTNGGNITSYHWIFSGPTDIPTSGDKTIEKEFPTAGDYVATLTVTDNDNLTGETKCNITVPIPTPTRLGSAPLTANFEVPQSLGTCQCTWTMCKKNPNGGCSDSGYVKEGCQISETFESEGTYQMTPTLTCGGKPVPAPVQEAVVLPSLGGVFAGGVSINQGSYQTKVVQKLADVMAITGEIKSPAHVNQIVDIVVYAHYYIPEGKLFFMIDSNGMPLPWDGNPANLVAFKPKIPLTSPHLVEMYKGQLIPGHLLGYLGYRLADGTLVTSNNPIDITITQ